MEHILSELQNVHYATGLVSQRIRRYHALEHLHSRELESIYHLVESHVPELRLKTTLRREKMFSSLTVIDEPLPDENYVGLSCTNVAIGDKINCLVEKLEEMPKEWTFVQLTSSFNPNENVEVDVNIHYTNPIHISLLDCGENKLDPFCITVDPPIDRINGEIINLIQEMHSIMTDNKEMLAASKTILYFANRSDKANYISKRLNIDQRLKDVVKCLQDLWLGEWRCLLIGKYLDEVTENAIETKIIKFLNKFPNSQINRKTVFILKQATKACGFLKPAELKKITQYCLPASEVNMKPSLPQFMNKLYKTLCLSQCVRHPIILIVDDILDAFPWEMVDVLFGEPVSRVPSLHFAHSLYKQHKATIENGYKILENYKNGSYILNPDTDLVNMQMRMKRFYDYWTPYWNGSVGIRLSEKEFGARLTSNEILSYNGHGSGSHIFPMEQIEKLRLKGVVLLFGCGSLSLMRLGPQVEMVGAHQMYIGAGSPCTVGMLWEVTDYETDKLTTKFLSTWIPSEDRIHWKFVDMPKWNSADGENLEFRHSDVSESGPHEPELLRALGTSKKSNVLDYYLTKAACVAKGIPVKIKTG